MLRSDGMLKKTWAVLGGIFLLLVLLGMAGGAYVVWQQNNAGLEANAATATLPPDRVTAEDMALGSPKAPLTMIEYYAQACSVCAAWDRDVFPQIKAKYIDTGRVRYVMRLFPLFPVDGPSYKLTRCVAPDNREIQYTCRRWIFCSATSRRGTTPNTKAPMRRAG